MKDSTFARSLIIWSAIMTILAGIIHIVLVPVHMDHAPAHEPHLGAIAG